MKKDLIIVESPAKVKTIKKILGNKYLVEATLGHIRDLPTNVLGVDEKNNFKPTYVILPGKEPLVKKLQQSAKKANYVLLAPDPDREGEAIAWHVAELIKDVNPNFKRMQFNEITASAIKGALNNLRDLDEDLFNSQQARRILDRLVGYKISPILWKKVKRGISAGRVQSVALRLIVDREKERQAFVPKEYWVFKVHLKTKKHDILVAELWKIDNKKANVPNEKKALELEKLLKTSKFEVVEVKEKERSRSPKPPFITSTLQQECNTRLGYSTKKVMNIAQHLYEGMDLGELGVRALITYMRTDSVRVAKEAQLQAKDWIGKNFGKEYLPPRIRNYKTKSSSQDAHEAIRPVDVTITPEMIKNSVSKDHYMVYKLIWERFVASQMASARILDTEISIKAQNTLWRAKGERIVFDGFLKVYSYGMKKELILPEVEKGEILPLQKIEKEQKFTSPPPRYTEASLVKKMEENGIGRPSTYAQVVSTLKEREYVKMEERYFVPTELGSVVSDLLVKHFPKLMDSGFTAEMELNLDKVAEGKLSWISLLKDFAKYLYPALDKALKEMEEIKTGKSTDIICDKCGSPMVIKFGKNGEFLACSSYPECKNTKNFRRDENGNIQIVDTEPSELEVVGKCPKCGGDLVVKFSRAGARFIACKNYPKCKYTEPFSTHIKCPIEGCDGEIVERTSKRGKVFYSCNRYPKCKFAIWNPPYDEICPECGFKILEIKQSKKRGKFLSCPNKKCNFWKKLEE
ncbi:type I DNA topoisomerase [Desulfothermus naphthae]